jgi:hypothetical protein
MSFSKVVVLNADIDLEYNWALWCKTVVKKTGIFAKVT